MEEIDLPELFEDIVFPEIEYMAVFNPDTGEVISVGPMFAFENEKYKVTIDTETAELIIAGKINIGSCFIDMNSQTLEIVEVKSVYKIDDVLHRIIGNEWSDIENPDVYVTYDSQKKTLKFELTEALNGTKKLDRPSAHRKILWDGDTVLNFLVTDYNDPNILYEMISMKISDLIGKSKIVKNLNLPKNISVYTRRVFKNYVMEYK